MKKILKIGKLELSILIYSPVVWIVLPIFCVLCGMNVLGALKDYQAALSLRGGGGSQLTREIYGLPGGFFVDIQQTLYLYLPILTMGIMSRETSSGSIKLLLSSPVKLLEIILGKYLALVMLCMAFVAILALFALIGIFSIEHADIGLLISGLFGLFLLICAYAAIGLFMSCLTNYQVVAAITTLAVFSVLRFIGTVGQSMDVVRDLTSVLSISGRTEMMISGLLSTKDIAYYLIIIFLFLSLCVLYLQNQRELKPFKVKAGRYAALLLMVLVAGYLTSRPVFIGYVDLTAGKQETIAASSQEITKKIDGKLKITTYVNLLAPNPGLLMPVFRNGDLESQNRYKRFIPGIENEYVYYYHNLVDTNLSVTKWNSNFKGINDVNQLAEKVALSSGYDIHDFMRPEQIDKLVDLKSEGYLQVRKLEYKGKSTFMHFYSNDEYGPYPMEMEWMAALKRLSVEDPGILFLTGNNETGITDKDDRGYLDILGDKSRRRAMVNQGFDVDTINLNKQNLPAKVNILVIADPTVSFSDATLGKLKQYIDQGGNLLITTNPGRQSVINPVLSALGVQVKPGMLVHPDKNLGQDQIAAAYSAYATGIDPNVAMFQQAKRAVILKGASALTYRQSGAFNIQPLLQSPDGGWNSAATININAPVLLFNANAGDEKGIFPVSLTLKRKVNGKEQRIIVSGDADYISNVQFTNATREIKEEKQLSVDVLFRWLAYGEFPVVDNRSAPNDLNITATKEQIAAMSIAFKFIFPAIMVLIGIIILFKRRNN
jgi:ABC-2 type transport system permease protein